MGVSLEEYTGLNHDNVIEMSYRLKRSWLYSSTTLPNLYFLHRDWSPLGIEIYIINGKPIPSMPLMSYEEIKINRMLRKAVKLKAVV